jgi:hypothetical protein
MAKNANESDASSLGVDPEASASADHRPVETDTAAMRDLVGGGAAYDQRRRRDARGRVETASGLIDKFSPEVKTPSKAGLPSWKDQDTVIVSDSSETDSPSPETAASEAMASLVPTKPGIVTIPKDREQWAKQIVQEVRLKNAPSEKDDADSRAEPPPVVTVGRRRIERRIGMVSVAVSCVLAGILLGRYVLSTAPSTGSSLSAAPQVSQALPVPSVPTASTAAQPAVVPSTQPSTSGTTPVPAVPQSSSASAARPPQPAIRPTTPATGAAQAVEPTSTAKSAPTHEPKPAASAPVPSPVPTDLKPF